VPFWFYKCNVLSGVINTPNLDLFTPDFAGIAMYNHSVYFQGFIYKFTTLYY
jgi:hypothetical protein